MRIYEIEHKRLTGFDATKFHYSPETRIVIVSSGNAETAWDVSCAEPVLCQHPYLTWSGSDGMWIEFS